MSRQVIGKRKWNVAVSDEMIIDAYNEAKDEIGSPDSPDEMDAYTVRELLLVPDHKIRLRS